MTSTVLAYIPSPSQGVWHLGPFPVRAYALFIIAGIIAALVIGDRRWVARGGEPGVIYDIALWAVPFGLIGGRLYHVITDWRTYFGADGAGFGAALRIWDGGLGIWGAVALGGLGAWIACRRRGIPLPAFGDAIAPGIILAQAVGRLGNYFNQELFGRQTTLPWGLEIYERVNAAGVPDSLNGVSTGKLIEVVHPTFLYELLWNLLVFAVLIIVDRRFRIGHGRLFALYVAGYCVGRFWVELMRSDAATHIAGIRVNSFTSTFVFIGAVVYIMVAPKGREDPASLRGKQEGEESRSEYLAKDLAVAASTTGVVAAATVAAEDDEQSVAEAAEDEAETQGLGGVEGGAEAEQLAPDVEEPSEGEPEPGEPAVDAEGEAEGLGAVEGGEVAEAVEDAAVAHEVAVEGEAEAQEVAAEVEAEEPAAEAEAEEPSEGEPEPGEPAADAETEERSEGTAEAQEVADEAEAGELAAEADESAEVGADSEAVDHAAERETETEGLGAIDGEEGAKAVEEAPVVHEAAVEGADAADALVADAETDGDAETPVADETTAEGDSDADEVEPAAAVQGADAAEALGADVEPSVVPNAEYSRTAALRPVGERVQRWIRRRRNR